MTSTDNNLLSEVATYYADKLAQYGTTAKGVDWNGEASQHIRFKQLCKIVEKSSDFSLNDLGCGYGALLDFLRSEYGNILYNGIDVSPEMIGAAQQGRPRLANCKFIIGNQPEETAEYSVASGIFNVRLNTSTAQWKNYVESTLDTLAKFSKIGFSFNCLTSYSDAEKMRAHLYYADPCELFDFCKRRYSRHVSLLHDYGLYEFTILVRKEI